MGLQPLAGGVDIVYRISQVAEITAAAQRLGIPVVGQFDLGIMVTRRGQIDQGKATGRDIKLAHHLQPECVTIKMQRGVNITDADHRVKIFHGVKVNGKTAIVMIAGPIVSAGPAALQDAR